MWIRSQNKRILSSVDEVIVTFVDENKCFISGFWGTGSDTLGAYSTKEKALKVLDDIEKELKYPYDEVFQMPADDEVVTVKKRVDYAEFRMLEEKEK